MKKFGTIPHWWMLGRPLSRSMKRITEVIKSGRTNLCRNPLCESNLCSYLLIYIKLGFRWYNVPLDSSKSTNGAPPKPSRASTGSLDTEGVEPDSKPLNFDTFVSNYDPSLP